jgi:putative ABC transport system ATP-binding protein
MSLVNAKNLTKVYSLGEIKVEALRSVGFEIESSSFVSFIGPSILLAVWISPLQENWKCAM